MLKHLKFQRLQPLKVVKIPLTEALTVLCKPYMRFEIPMGEGR